MKCSDVYYFFNQISGRTVTATVSQPDLDSLKTGGYIQVLSKDEYGKLSADVDQIGQLTSSIAQEKNQEQQERAEYVEDFKKTHSIFFHLGGREKEETEEQKASQDAEALRNITSDISGKETLLTSYISKKSQFDKLVPFGDSYVSLTESGLSTMKDLGIRIYRASDMEFPAYVQQMNLTISELDGIASRAAQFYNYIYSAVSDTDTSHIWSTAVGLAKIQGDTAALANRFISSYNSIDSISHNVENRLMAAEVLTCSGADLSSSLPALEELDHELRHKADVPKELSAGITSILFFGRRYDGTFPLDTFSDFRQITGSYESAAVMSVVNAPPDDIKKKFMSAKTLFSSWGFQVSEDTELSAAYLSVSDIPPEGLQTKLSIITEGLKHYLEYPLVAAAILASIPVMEANETLNLLEKSYSIIGTRAGGLEQSELIALGVRMIHGIKNELVRDLDSTARIAETPVQFTYAASRPFMPLYVPLILVHSSYYSTFSGIGGVHPGHVHGFGGFYG